MDEKIDQAVRPDARKPWQTPEIREQTIHSSTAKGKTGSPTQENTPLAGKPS